ncbi:nuclease-related domain-containing protein [Heyndrickxia acidicola]|uniref:Nuclease-related domain-containing protein n=1 Tax=Heyndrickxia acidicola TaxID=209389 RepID=A0ABU6MF39_9BACI|nr:nuclease-related domain-containing protein [Heyndrickxia acidicola]MED1203284.1 nuclease-related domain-containing protein [Heyndrickxia acidicola]
MISKLFAKLSKKEIEKPPTVVEKPKKKESRISPSRIGELGEYKINIQLDQLPRECRYISDVLLANPKSKSGYSQIDHVILTPYGVFVIEAKNYTGTIYGARDRAKWSVNGKFPMNNPFHQNFGHIQAIRTLLDIQSSNMISMISFTRRCTFKVDRELRNIQSNDLILYDTELTEFITRKLNVLRLQLKTPIFTDGKVQDMYKVLKEQNITDKKVRELHIEKINGKVNISN